MRIRITLGAILIISLNALGQPGYMGKKFFIKYDLMFFPAWNNPSFNNKASIRNFNTDHSVTLGVSLNRKHALELGAGYGRTSLKINSINDLPGNTEYYWGYDEDVPESKLVFYQFNLKYTVYSSKPGNIAPFGRYSSYVFSYFYNYIGEKFENQEIYFIEQNTPLLFSYYIGHRDIFFDRLMIDYSFGTGLILNFDNLIQRESSQNDVSFTNSSYKRLFNLYLLQFKVGVGLVY